MNLRQLSIDTLYGKVIFYDSQKKNNTIWLYSKTVVNTNSVGMATTCHYNSKIVMACQHTYSTYESWLQCDKQYAVKYLVIEILLFN